MGPMDGPAGPIHASPIFDVSGQPDDVELAGAGDRDVGVVFMTPAPTS